MGEQFGVSEFPETGTVISHGVGGSRDIIMAREVSMETLVECLDT
jgi:hypothetical protein